MCARWRQLHLRCLSYGSLASGATESDPVSRLRTARSLRCHFTAEADTKWTKGQRSITNEALNPDVANEVVYDSIDVRKGKARIVGNIGASDVAVHADSFGAIWIVDVSPAGFVFVTTIMPLYAAGTEDFIVLESRHSWVGQSALGEQPSGSCALLE